MPALIHHRRTNPLGTPSLPAHSRDLRTSHCRHFQPPDFAPKIFKLSFFRGVASLSFLVMELLSCVNCNYLNNNNEAKMPIREIWARKEGAI